MLANFLVKRFACGTHIYILFSFSIGYNHFCNLAISAILVYRLQEKPLCDNIKYVYIVFKYSFFRLKKASYQKSTSPRRPNSV